jgi:vacuole morphology and inheritance protein 14
MFMTMFMLMRLTREAVVANDTVRVQRIIDVLSQDFAYSLHGNARSGGLIGLAAVAIALGMDTGSFLHTLVPPVLACLADQESRVRYYACESMYNIIKVARGKALVYFNELFDILSKVIISSEDSLFNYPNIL